MKNMIINTIKYFIVFFITMFIAVNIVSFTQILGDSMEPNIDSGTVMILNKIHYKIFEPARNDIIAFSSSTDRNLIKRIVGLPGESVEYKDNMLIINGEVINENLNLPETPDFKLSELGYNVIPDDMYLVLGDNRTNSYDSREFGLINEKNIIGKCGLTIWPLL